MKKKILIAFFTIAIIGLGAFFVFTKYFKTETVEKNKQPRIVTPKHINSEQTETESENNQFDTESFTSFVPLLSTETLISTQILDIDNDTYDDQIIVVRKSRSPYLFIVVGIYNTQSESYERISEISTQISKTGTFSYSTLDVIGNHQPALIFEGIKDDGNAIMQIFICTQNNDRPEMMKIGDFESDGTVFIQQTERSESYEMALSNGESFSVWVYSSEKIDENAENPQKNTNSKAGQNQVQTEYRWNSHTQSYEFNKSVTVTLGKLQARELSRIQDGTVETFANFLNGLWYKTSNTDSTIRYLFFDYPSNEIIFLNGSVEEVYTWEDSKIRHNGIYITTANSIIASLHRRLNVVLTNVDEINLFIRDDVNLLIGENSLWDGQYKKASMSSFSLSAAKKAGMEEKIVKKLWTENLSEISLVLSESEYTATSKTAGEEKGTYNFLKINDDLVLQIRAKTGHVLGDAEYLISYGTKIVEETVKRTTVQKIVTDETTLILTPVRVTPKECLPTEGRILTFSLQE